MNNELIERIDEVTNNWGSVSSFKASGVLIDCKAEIERLLLANETLTALNAEYAGRIKAQQKAFDIESNRITFANHKSFHKALIRGAIKKINDCNGSPYLAWDTWLIDAKCYLERVLREWPAPQEVTISNPVPPYLDELIAEIDGLPRYHYAIEREGCLACEPHENGDTVDFGELQEALDKYRGVT